MASASATAGGGGGGPGLGRRRGARGDRLEVGPRHVAEGLAGVGEGPARRRRELRPQHDDALVLGQPELRRLDGRVGLARARAAERRFVRRLAAGPVARGPVGPGLLVRDLGLDPGRRRRRGGRRRRRRLGLGLGFGRGGRRRRRRGGLGLGRRRRGGLDAAREQARLGLGLLRPGLARGRRRRRRRLLLRLALGVRVQAVQPRGVRRDPRLDELAQGLAPRRRRLRAQGAPHEEVRVVLDLADVRKDLGAFVPSPFRGQLVGLARRRPGAQQVLEVVDAEGHGRFWLPFLAAPALSPLPTNMNDL